MQLVKSWKHFFPYILIVTLVVSAFPLEAATASSRLNALLQRRGWIRIGLSGSDNSVTIGGADGASVLVDGRTVTCSSGILQLRKSAGGLTITGAGSSDISAREAEVAPAQGRLLTYDGKTYRGKFRVTAGGSLRVVNVIMIDDWLKGVLPAEIGSDSPVEALKAQAVAGRSEAIFRLAKPPHDSEGYDFCTGVHCQANKGIGEENPAIVKACDDTLGYVLIADADVLNAVYHNVCGGVTAGAEEVWDSKPIPGLSPVFDKLKGAQVDLTSEAAVRQFLESPGNEDFCYPGNPGYANYAKKYHRWKKTLSASEIGRAAGVGDLQDIQVTQRMRSGRVRKLTVSGSRGTKTIDKELNIRHTFDLWSGLFVLDIERSAGRISSVTFSGAGNGHGVGLCQHGARDIARRGGTFDQILGHYYPGAELKKIYRP